MSRSRNQPPGVDPKLLIKDAAKLLPEPSRRLFLRGAASLGALAVLSGCDIVDGETSENVLRVISTFNDRVQALLFDPNTLAPEYPESAITRPFPFNAYYSEDEAPDIDAEQWQLEIGGLVDNKKPWTLPELNKLPEVSQITRHVCVEGWSAIGSWQGVKFSDFLKLVGADTTAKYVWFQCAEGYSNTIDMPTALHPQTQLTLKFDHKVLPRAYGFPMKIRIPDQARLQEPEIRHRDVGAEQRRRRLLGEPGLQLVQRALMICLLGAGVAQLPHVTSCSRARAGSCRMPPTLAAAPPAGVAQA